MNDRSGKPTNAGDAFLPALRARREGNRPGRPVLIEVHLNRRRIEHLCRALLLRAFQHVEYPPFGFWALGGNLTATQHSVRTEPPIDSRRFTEVLLPRTWPPFSTTPVTRRGRSNLRYAGMADAFPES